jgi:PilZ domain
MTDERRRFERVDIPESARIQVLDSNGKKLGLLKILGRGGMLFCCETPYPPGARAMFQICDHEEGITRSVNTIVRYFNDEGIACEFEKLEIDAAVDIGVWIGKFYSSQA